MACQSTPLARNTSTYYTQPRRQAIPSNRDVTDVSVAAQQRRHSATIWVRVDPLDRGVFGGGGTLRWRWIDFSVVLLTVGSEHSSCLIVAKIVHVSNTVLALPPPSPSPTHLYR